jgi:uncharacterized circularly permuted ATP-grasp superfamily protein
MKKFHKLIPLFLIALFFVSCADTAKRDLASKEPFDEIYGMSGSEKIVRPVYQDIIGSYNSMSIKDKQAFYKKSMADFSGDNALHPLPRVLAETEYEYLKRGVVQRGKALRAFLVDHYSGKKEYAKNGIIPASIISRIMQRSHEQLWEGKVSSDSLNFWYGPDVIRGPPEPGFPEGRFVVVEDNPGFIGGIGDLIQARRTFFQANKALKKITDSPDPKKFYSNLASSYKKRAKKYGGIPVVIQYTANLAADNEDKRIKEIFEKQGIKVVPFNPFSRQAFKGEDKIITDKDGVFLVTTKDGKQVKEKVGYIVSNMDPQDLEFSHESNRPKRIMMEAEELLELKQIDSAFKDKLAKLMKANVKTGKVDYEKIARFIEKESPYLHDIDKAWGIRGLIDASFTNKVGMTNSPGMEFIGDKEFYIYVEDIIRFYLKEEPILGNMETGSFRAFSPNGDAILNQAAVEKVVAHFDDYVVKGVDGRGGDAVWVGPKVAQEERERVMDLVRKNPGRYIFQRYNALSTMGDFISDLRLLSDVSSQGVIVANVPWSRVVSKNGDGKVNISAQGYEATVLIHRALKTGTCKDMAGAFLGK